MKISKLNGRSKGYIENGFTHRVVSHGLIQLCETTYLHQRLIFPWATPSNNDGWYRKEMKGTGTRSRYGMQAYTYYFKNEDIISHLLLCA